MSKPNGSVHPVVIGIGLSIFLTLWGAVYLIPLPPTRADKSVASTSAIEADALSVGVPPGQNLRVLSIARDGGTVPVEVTWTPSAGGRVSTATIPPEGGPMMVFRGPGTFRVHHARGVPSPVVSYKLEPDS